MEQTLQLLIPVLALALPVSAVVFYGLHRVLRLRIEEARVRGAAAEDGELQALRAEIAEIRGELAELHERLDFTERMLTRDRDRHRLPETRKAD